MTLVESCLISLPLIGCFIYAIHWYRRAKVGLWRLILSPFVLYFVGYVLLVVIGYTNERQLAVGEKSSDSHKPVSARLC